MGCWLPASADGLPGMLERAVKRLSGQVGDPEQCASSEALRVLRAHLTQHALRDKIVDLRPAGSVTC